MHEGFLAMKRAADTFDGAKGYKFETYASRCIENRIRDLARRAKGLGELGAMLNPDDLPVPDPRDRIELENMRAELETALLTCTQLEQAIIGLHLQGYSYTDIVGKLNVDKKKIDNTIQKVRKLLV